MFLNGVLLITQLPLAFSVCSHSHAPENSGPEELRYRKTGYKVLGGVAYVLDNMYYPLSSISTSSILARFSTLITRLGVRLS
jgi:hypothetical protein